MDLLHWGTSCRDTSFPIFYDISNIKLEILIDIRSNIIHVILVQTEELSYVDCMNIIATFEHYCINFKIFIFM